MLLGQLAREEYLWGPMSGPRYRQCNARDFSALACFTRIDRIAALWRVRPVLAVQ
ncbi:hypothetical protein GCM10027288_07880 [Bordetella tumbae]